MTSEEYRDIEEALLQIARDQTVSARERVNAVDLLLKMGGTI